MNKILTFGVYDYFHLGHLRLFKQCKEYADFLIVAVQDGNYILKYKPDAKVLYSTDERIEMLEALRIVDKVITYQQVSVDTIEKNHFEIIGASCHSLEEAKEAERLGCTYITAGHIFLTDCKKGLPGRGLTFLQNICENVSIPVYAIGGISNENINDVRQTGAAGACIMSGFMKCNNIAEII